MDLMRLERALECHKCGRWVENVGEEAVKVTCSYCILMVVGFPTGSKSYQPTGHPPGWHFMSEYVDVDGNVFHKGKEMKKLKGTLKPTKVKPRKKIKRRTKEQMLVDRHNKKKEALKKAVQKQKDFLNHEIHKG